VFRKVIGGQTMLHLKKRQTVFSEGEKADAIYFLQSGKLKLTAISPTGKEAVLRLLSPGDVFGEECVAGPSLRTETATALEPSIVIRIAKSAVKSSLRRHPDFSDKFIAALLASNRRLKEDLRDHFFNHSEKRLARILLKLAHAGDVEPERYITLPRISHETLAEMVGTTRSRVTYFMNKFRKKGLVHYDGELIIRPRLLDAVLRD
jgi:CRP-like cAMP-binding protein